MSIFKAPPVPATHDDVLAMLRRRRGSVAMRETLTEGRRRADYLNVDDPERLADEFSTEGSTFIFGDTIRREAPSGHDVLILHP